MSRGGRPPAPAFSAACSGSSSLAALLGGVVAVNVALLRLNVRLDGLAQERTELKRENATVGAAALAGRLRRCEQIARGRLGLVPATPDATTYVQLRRR